MQQDAEECWTQFLYCLRKLPKVKSEKLPSEESVVQQLFQGELVSEWVCKEAEEDKTTTKTSFEKIPCHIDEKTNYLSEGLAKALEEEVEKFSPSLNRTAVYTKKSKINRLPYYLTVQFVRFYWKPSAGVKAKIVRPIEFPLNLDLYDYCSDSYKEHLNVKRTQLVTPDTMKIATDTSVSMPPDQLVNETGIYELVAVLTHKGMRADSGHYVAYIRCGKQDEWLQYDDRAINPCKYEDIKKLSGKGGGDWHLAYLCIYKTKHFEPPKQETANTSTQSIPMELN